ncbi:MAG: acyltransferase [Prevotellaceae bacterium]|jgi:acetyltransferase-like isoleucine patch superfamily enzyme|nr:acyltransferase [Prevotellaceae bacterium]
MGLMKTVHSGLSVIQNYRYIKTLLKHNVQLQMPFIIYHNKENLILGENIYIGPDSILSLEGKLTIESGTIIGPRLKVHTSNHNYESNMLPYNDECIVKNVHIGQNVWIGADVSIMPGVEIGEGCVVAACSVITENIPPYSVVGGNPAKLIKYRDIENYKKNLEEGNIYLKLKKEGKTRTDIRRYISSNLHETS